MDVVNRVLASSFGEDVSVVTSSNFPQIGSNPSSRFGAVRDSLLDRFGYQFHGVDLFERMNENMHVVGHEDIGEDNVAMFLGRLIDAIGKGLADSVIFEMLAPEVS